MKTVLLAALVAVLAAAPLAAASTVTGHYTVGNVAVVGLIFSPGLPVDQTVSVGGYTFPANAGVPTRVTVTDTAGMGVFFTVCQDLNGQVCGEAGEPTVSGCGSSVLLGSSAVPFQANRATSVFVFSASTGGCVGAATTGDITITYNP